MAVSLESRVPLLDQEVVAFALSLPLSFKRSDGEGKLLLRRILNRFMPPELFDRPKKGFGVPVSDWIRGALREWAEETLRAVRRKHSDFLNWPIIERKWQEHVNRGRDWGQLLWPVLMFETWFENWTQETVSCLRNQS
jgi:asparagine synthase (glutamine-hydrolysing)